MYAQLCVRLNELAPNFEDISSTTTTFRRLLLAKCKEEFDNRTKATAIINKDDLTSEKDDEKGVVKRKMLGNVKFIGELFKLGMLHEKIIHQCIQELLEKKKVRDIIDTSDDMECLCHLMSTVGERLDTSKAKSWMDQYFKRMISLSNNEDLSPRMQFMLIDIIELRDNKWVHRKSRLMVNPKPIERSPQPVYRPHHPYVSKSFVVNGDRSTSYQRKGEDPASSNAQPMRTKSYDIAIPEMKKIPSNKKSDSTVSLRPSAPTRKFQQIKLSEAKSDTPPTDTPTGPHPLPINQHQVFVRPPPQSKWSSDNAVPPQFLHQTPPIRPVMGYTGHPPFPPPHMMAPGYPTGHMAPLHYPPPQRYPQQPSFVPGAPPPQWRAPPTYFVTPTGYHPRPSKDVVAPPFRDHSQSPPIKRVTKSGKKGTAVGAKRNEPSKDEKIIVPILERYLSSSDIPGVADTITGVSTVLPVNVITILINKTITSSEDVRCEISQLFEELNKREYLTSTLFIKASGNVLQSLHLSDSTTALIRNAIAGYLARAVIQGLTSLTDITSLFNDGAHHPTVLVVLQALMNLIGQDGVQSRFQSEAIMMTSLLPASQRSYEAISQMLETRNLGFLYPLKHIQSQLKSILKQPNVTAVAVYKWLKTNVDNQLFKNPEFIMLLTKSILSHVTSNSSLPNPSHDSLSQEKKLMEEYKLIIQKLVHEDSSLQMTVVHSTQVFCHDCNFPKGLLLRLFAYWYEMDVIEEEVLLQWREDPSDRYPGKGKALFQVNQWLMLLAAAEEEDSDNDD